MKADALPKKIKVDEAYVKAHAKPGEKDFDAWQRCRAEVKGPKKAVAPKPTTPPLAIAAPAPATPESIEAGRIARANITALQEKMKIRNNRG